MDPNDQMRDRRGVGETREQVQQEFDDLREAVMQKTEQLRDSVGSFVQERPIASVAIGFGVGYLLSGALYSRATMRLLGLGSRFLFAALLKPMVAGGGLSALASLIPDRERIQH
jgi:hypothetical protein